MLGRLHGRTPQAALGHGRLDALVDGVYSVALTLLILNLNVPAGLGPNALWAYLQTLMPKVLAFVLSFVMAGSAWIYVHQMAALYTTTNLGHTIRTVMALMFVCALPLTSAALGSYPDTPFGPAVYSGNVMLLVAIYAFDLAMSRKSLISPAVDRRLVGKLLALHVGAIAWAAFCCFYLSFSNPRWAIAGVFAYVVMHWVSIWWFEPEMHIARAAIEAESRRA